MYIEDQIYLWRKTGKAKLNWFFPPSLSLSYISEFLGIITNTGDSQLNKSPQKKALMDWIIWIVLTINNVFLASWSFTNLVKSAYCLILDFIQVFHICRCLLYQVMSERLQGFENFTGNARLRQYLASKGGYLASSNFLGDRLRELKGLAAEIPKRWEMFWCDIFSSFLHLWFVSSRVNTVNYKDVRESKVEGANVVEVLIIITKFSQCSWLSGWYYCKCADSWKFN